MKASPQLLEATSGHFVFPRTSVTRRGMALAVGGERALKNKACNRSSKLGLGFFFCRFVYLG